MSAQDQISSAERRPLQARGIATRDRLMEAAKELLVRKGYEGTSIGDIAERAGVGVGTVYHHFEDKRAILIHLLDEGEGGRIVADAGAGTAAAMASSDPRAAFEELLLLFASVRREQPSIYTISLEPARRDQAIAARCRRIERERRLFIQHDIEAGQRSGTVRDDVDPEACSYWIYVMVHSAMTMAQNEDHDDFGLLIHELSEIICDRLLPR